MGLDLADAIWVAPNNARAFAEVPSSGVVVVEGLMGGEEVVGVPDARGEAVVDEVVAALRGTDVLVNFLPVGAQRATELYARAALLAGCAFVNCMPSVIARDSAWAARFAAAGLPLIGDDLKSSFGATLVHRALVDALTNGGVALHNTYQLLGGGNADFLNLQDPARLSGKRATKVAGAGAAAHVSAAYIPFLEDRKVAYIRLEGEGFGGSPVEVEVRMSVEDSPSAAGNVLDAVRQAKAALDTGTGGVLPTTLMKS
ncbi:inositol-3-phosphate synthase [Nonomuraea sp. NPDC050790]|uniref:inositol-3-phosphate synthase n=1 Tax=Nonomuraea sp. NPDC050790 TaxID=3364371 RepID=UPI003799988F